MQLCDWSIMGLIFRCTWPWKSISITTWPHLKQTHVSHTGLPNPKTFDLRKKTFQPDSQWNLSFEVIRISDSFLSPHSLPSYQPRIQNEALSLLVMWTRKSLREHYKDFDQPVVGDVEMRNGRGFEWMVKELLEDFSRSCVSVASTHYLGWWKCWHKTPAHPWVLPL